MGIPPMSGRVVLFSTYFLLGVKLCLPSYDVAATYLSVSSSTL